jgi:hypothetical protein
VLKTLAARNCRGRVLVFRVTVTRVRLVALVVVLFGCHSSGAPAAPDAAVPADAAPRMCAVGSGATGCPAGELCEETSLIAPGPGTCAPLPAVCLATPTCACLMANPSGCTDQCSGSGSDLAVVCVGI